MVHLKGTSERKGSCRGELVSLQTSGGGGNGIYWSVPWESATCSPVSLRGEGVSSGASVVVGEGNIHGPIQTGHVDKVAWLVEIL